MEAIGGAPALVLGGLLLLSVLIAGLLMRRRQAGLYAQTELLRRERDHLAEKLRAGRARIGTLRNTVARLEQINGRLLQEQDRLESEHAELSQRFAELEARLDDGGPVLVPNPITELARPDISAGSPRPSASVTALTRPSRRPPGLPAYARAAGSHDSVSQRHATLPFEEDPLDQLITTDLGPDSLNEDFENGTDGVLTTIEKVSARLPLTIVKTSAQASASSEDISDASADRNARISDQMPLQAALRSPQVELTDLSAMREQLSNRDAEIERLRSQLSPLLGLPLVVAAREAERDRLAACLARREARLRELEPVRSHLSAAAEEDSRPADFGPTASPGLDWPGDETQVWTRVEATPIELAREAEDLKLSEHILTEEPIPVRQYAHVPDPVDNLKRIRGIGPVIERMLNRLGVYQYRQIASWTPADVAFFDQALQDFSGRIERDDWIRGARIQLARKYTCESE